MNPAARPAPYANVLDPTAMRDLLELSQQGGGVLLGKLVDAYVEGDSPKAIVGMQSAVTAGNTLNIAKAAHGLKGSSGVFGATRLVRLLANVEREAKAGNLAAVEGLLSPVGAEVDSVKCALTAYRGSHCTSNNAP